MQSHRTEPPGTLAAAQAIANASFFGAAVGAWPETPIRDTSCCGHPLTAVPYLRPGPGFVLCPAVLAGQADRVPNLLLTTLALAAAPLLATWAYCPARPEIAPSAAVQLVSDARRRQPARILRSVPRGEQRRIRLGLFRPAAPNSCATARTVFSGKVK